MCPSAPRVCSEPGVQKPVLSLSLDLIGLDCICLMTTCPERHISYLIFILRRPCHYTCNSNPYTGKIASLQPSVPTQIICRLPRVLMLVGEVVGAAEQRLRTVFRMMFNAGQLRSWGSFHLQRGHIASLIDINSLGPSDAISRQKTGSTLAQVMACCLTAQSHYLNQCWLIISKV